MGELDVTDKERKLWNEFCTSPNESWYDKDSSSTAYITIRQDYVDFENDFIAGVPKAKKKMVRFIAWKLKS